MWRKTLPKVLLHSEKCSGKIVFEFPQTFLFDKFGGKLCLRRFHTLESVKVRCYLNSRKHFYLVNMMANIA